MDRRQEGKEEWKEGKEREREGMGIGEGGRVEPRLRMDERRER